jgi:hypothetical protein
MMEGGLKHGPIEHFVWNWELCRDNPCRRERDDQYGILGEEKGDLKSCHHYTSGYTCYLNIKIHEASLKQYTYGEQNIE